MSVAAAIRVADERSARADLRAQIATLEGRGGRAPATGGPRLLSLGELERELERMVADPGAHRWARVPLVALGEPGCGAYVVRPRLGLIGMLAGWWEVKLSSGCP